MPDANGTPTFQEMMDYKNHHNFWQSITGQSAAWDEQQAIQKAMDQQRGFYDQSRQDQAPWLQAGQLSLQQLMQGIQSGAFSKNIDPSQIANDPGYQFRMQQGQQALERSAAARGNLNSGGFMKALDRYSQGEASQEYGNAWNRNFEQNQANFGNLAGIAGIGQSSGMNLGQLGQGYANSGSSLWGAMGNAQAAGDSAVPKFLGSLVGTGLSLATGIPGLGSLGQGLGGGGGQGGGFGGYNPSGYSLIPTQGQNMPSF